MPFRCLLFQVNSTSKKAKLPRLRAIFKLPVLRCHGYWMALRFRSSFVTGKINRWAKFSLFRSLQINKQQNQWTLSINLQRTFGKRLMILFQYTKWTHSFLTMELFKLLSTFSQDLMKEIFSLNDASVLNPEVPIECKMAYSLVFLAPKISELVWHSINNFGLPTTF